MRKKIHEKNGDFLRKIRNLYLYVYGDDVAVARVMGMDEWEKDMWREVYVAEC